MSKSEAKKPARGWANEPQVGDSCGSASGILQAATPQSKVRGHRGGSSQVPSVGHLLRKNRRGLTIFLDEFSAASGHDSRVRRERCGRRAETLCVAETPPWAKRSPKSRNPRRTGALTEPKNGRARVLS